ncbi:hypothetical protein CHUAL_005243 [Chamberlinius hualienensis]
MKSFQFSISNMAFKIFLFVLTVVMLKMTLTPAQDFYSHWDNVKNNSQCVPINSTWEKERQAEFATCIEDILKIDINDNNFTDAVYSVVQKDEIRDVLMCTFTKRGVVVNGTFDIEKNNEFFFDHVNFTDPDDRELLEKERQNCYDENKDDCEETVVCTFMVTLGVCGVSIDLLKHIQGGSNNGHADDTASVQ